ncbi:MAG: VacJ family lipoprotein [Pseudomonadota bacterium]
MSDTIKNFTAFIGLFAAVLLVSACASDNSDGVMAGDVVVSDPFESTNRAVFSFNNAVDDAIIHPIAKGYNAVLPAPARTGVDNALKNLRSPVNFANQVLQGDLDGAGDVFVRAVINTLLGLGGLVDLAGHEGIEYEVEDFGQTLAKWGVDHGPYLVVPIVGPSSARDYVGFAVDAFADPLRWYLFNIGQEGIFYGKAGLEYLNLRASLVEVLEDLEKSSIDYYAATRSAYYQRREALVNDQGSDVVTAPAIPDYDDY